MERTMLKCPGDTYQKRLNRFLWLLVSVKGLKPRNVHLWRVMDGVAFQDTETALETALYNEGRSLDAGQVERLTMAIVRDKRGGTRSRRKAANG